MISIRLSCNHCPVALVYTRENISHYRSKQQIYVHFICTIVTILTDYQKGDNGLTTNLTLAVSGYPAITAHWLLSTPESQRRE